MAHNKFIKKDGEVLLDLTSDTVASDKLMSGVTAHDKFGNLVTGTFSVENLDSVIAELETKTATLNTTLANKAAGSGGGSVETCTVTFDYIDYIYNLSGALHYTKPDLTFGSAFYQASREAYVPPVSVTVLKNSIVVLAGSVDEGGIMGFAEEFRYDCQGDCEPLIESFIGGCALYVTGDCIISGSNG